MLEIMDDEIRQFYDLTHRLYCQLDDRDETIREALERMMWMAHRLPPEHQEVAMQMVRKSARSMCKPGR